MPDPEVLVFEATYRWTCDECHTECLAIRRFENTPLSSVYCPSCGARITVCPVIRREQLRKLVSAAESLTGASA
jgi:predicted nucleic acid-binding Zn ribbon protein